MRAKLWISVTAVLAMAGAAVAADFPPLKREPVLDDALPAGSPTPALVKGARIRFAPGQPTGAHLHPVSVAGVVTEGSFVFQVEGGPTRTLKTGDPFFEPANAHILHFDNSSKAQPAEIVAFYLTDKADRPMIQMLMP